MSFSNIPWYVWLGMAEVVFVVAVFVAAAWRVYFE